LSTTSSEHFARLQKGLPKTRKKNNVKLPSPDIKRAQPKEKT